MLGGLLAFLFLLPKKAPDPRILLENAATRSEQNLCLLAILEKDPEDPEAQARLLENYQVLGADPLTIAATAQKFGVTAPETKEINPEEPGKLISTAGIAKRKQYKDTYAVADGADTIYYATNEGIYADYQGLKVKISGIRAEGMTAAEGGIYFINTDQKKVQYLARDGHKIQTLSMIDAQNFAFFQGQLWIVGTDGTLYCGDTPMETSAPIRMLAATADTLYASFNDERSRAAGVLAFDTVGNSSALLSSPAFSLFGGSDGNLYYINEFGYPMCYNTETKKATILIEKKAVAVSYEEDTVYYLNEKGKIKKIA